MPLPFMLIPSGARWLPRAFILILALGFVGLIFWLREEDEGEEEETQELPQSPASDLESPAPKITSDHIEDSRYDG